MDDYALELVDLVKDFEGKRAVDGFSLQLKKGNILGLLGPNGAGKTTSIRMIMNIISPDSGEIKIFGQGFSEELKNLIGYLPEERGLYRKLRVSETLNYFGQLKGMKKESIRVEGHQLLEKFNLDQYADKKVEELSKGMAQKLQFITTIMHSPRLLILDEPFSGLDPVNIEMVKDIILEKKREGVSIIFSTHLMDYAEKIVDTVVMINNGRQVLNGELGKIKSRYGTKLIKIKYEGDLEFLKEWRLVENIRDYGKEAEIEMTDLNQKDILIRKIMDRVSLNSFQVTEPSLNNIFIRKVSEEEQGEVK